MCLAGDGDRFLTMAIVKSFNYRARRVLLFDVRTDDSISGQSAVDAVAAGCVYLSPVMARPTDNIYNSQYNHLAQNAKDQYACSFERKVTPANPISFSHAKF